MTKHAVPIRVRAILLSTLLLCALSSTRSMATTLALGSSTQIPAAEGTVKLHYTKNQNIEFKLEVKHLAPPERIVPGAQVFVLWIRGLADGDVAQNLGALRVDKNLGAKFTSVTAMKSFDLFLTCEQSQTVTVPASPELLPVQVKSH